MLLANTRLAAQASATYKYSGSNLQETIKSNIVIIEVAAVPSLSLQGDELVLRTPGTRMVVPYRLLNTGNTELVVKHELVNATGCTGGEDTADISNLRVVLDANSNGVLDPAEANNASSTVTLKAAESASLLVVGDVPLVQGGGACLQLTANVDSLSLTKSLKTFVSLAEGPLVQLTKHAEAAAALKPGGTDWARYVLMASNSGNRDALATSTAVSGQTITVDGVATTLLLLRDPLPEGAVYRSGSLQASTTNALKLYRKATDALYAYTTQDLGAAAAEVAVGYPFSLVPGQAVTLSFEVSASATAGSMLSNVAQMHYCVASCSSEVRSLQSNAAIVPVAGQRLGLAHWVVGKKVNFDTVTTTTNINSITKTTTNTVPDNTVSYTLSLKVRNDGDMPLFNVQVPHVLSGKSMFGEYTSATVPAKGQYTVVAGSLKVLSYTNSATTLSVNTSFTGDGSQTGLLAPGLNGVVLPSKGEFTLVYQVRVNAQGRGNEVLSSQVTGQASLVASRASADVTDVSTNGSDPDPDGDFNPNNNSEVTPIALPDMLGISNIASALVLSGDASSKSSRGEFETVITLTLKNQSDFDIPSVRLVNNLACFFRANDPESIYTSWKLIGVPVATLGVLAGNSSYKGELPDQVPCDLQQHLSDDPLNVPFAPEVVVNDVTKPFPARSTEVFVIKALAMKKLGSKVPPINSKAWLFAVQDTQVMDPTIMAASTNLLTRAIDPQGYVYDAETRKPVPGTSVTLRRESCQTGPATAITPEEIYNPSKYTFDPADRSVSMTTEEDGLYEFVWLSPPVTDLCVYSIHVKPPSAHVISSKVKVQPGTFTGCGAVVPNEDIPVNVETTTWYASVLSGYSASRTPPECAVLNNHIPLDPVRKGTALLLSKQANKSQAEIGDFVDYQLKLTNRADVAVVKVAIDDVLPPGFSYVPGSSWLGNTRLQDPAVRRDPVTGRASLSYDLGAARLEDKAELTVRYRLRIGVGAVNDADAINSAVATALSAAAPMPLQSNTAQAKVRVSGGVFTTQGFAIGKVWADCNRNGLQDGADEPGVPGVRLYMEDGTTVITDQFGRWSLYGLKPLTHALRVDLSTLPAGTTLAALDNRHAGQAHSRFLDVKNGEMVRADFAIAGCEAPDLLKEIESRQKLFAKALDQQLQALVSARLPAESRTAVQGGDSRGQPASGVIAGAVAAVGQPPMQAEGQTLPLIRLPSSMAQGLGGAGQGAPPAPKPIGAPPASNANEPKLPATGTEALPGMASLSGSFGDALWGRQVTFSPDPMEEQVEALPIEVGFIELKDWDTVTTEQIRVRVAGPKHGHLHLFVNGQEVPDNRIGKKVTVNKTGLLALEFIGVRLIPGPNLLELRMMDDFGNVRQSLKLRVRSPEKLSRMQLQPQGRLAADPLRPAQLKLVLSDAAGVPIMERTAITLQAQGAQWLTPDLDPSEPGLQIFVEGGEAMLQMQPPGQQGVVTVTLASGTATQTETLTFLPALNPLQGIGMVEGVLDLRQSGRVALTQNHASSAFEQQLTGMVSESADARAAARTAFYFKGAISGDYLLTAAYDSAKVDRERLFRDIRPDEFYPVYGDGSVRGFDAQSAGQLYVRIDKNRSFLLLGDFNTTSSPEARQLSQYGRTLSGLLHRYQDDKTRSTSFYAETTSTQQVEELPAVGLSFYTLANVLGTIRPGSEKVEILVRDRQQPQTVLSTRALTRFVDYSFEPLSRRLFLVQPLSSYDDNLNPQSIRITYELDTGGTAYKVMGADVQTQVADNVQLGVVAVRDDNPQNPRQLQAVTALVRVTEDMALNAERVQTHTELKGKGEATRVTLRHDSPGLRGQAQVLQTSPGFDNLNATTGAGRTEATASVEHVLSPVTALRAEASLSRESTAASAVSSQRSALGLSAAHKFNEQLVGEVGLVHSTGAGSSAGSFNYGQVGSLGGLVGGGAGGGGGSMAPSGGTAAPPSNAPGTRLRTRLSVRPESLPRLQFFTQYEQDIEQRDNRSLSMGSSYALSDKTRIYAQHALATQANTATPAVNGQRLTQATTVGIDSAYMEGGRAYNEYRITGRNAAPQNASGVRNTFKLGESLTLNSGFERVQSVGSATTGTTSAASSNSTAMSLGADWAHGPWRLSSATEQRQATTTTNSLYSLAGAVRLDDDLVLLARHISTTTHEKSRGAANDQQRQQIGLAWRPAHADAWNVLARYEHRLQDVSTGTAAAGDTFTAGAANSSAGLTENHIVSLHAHWQPARGRAISLHQATKTTRLDDVTATYTYWAHLVHARYTQDLTRDWDLGLQAGHLWGRGRVQQNTLGLELGYQLVRGLWLSGGYNVLGLSDPDLAGQNHTSRGAYIRLRWKFDEAVFQFGRVAEQPSQSAASLSTPTATAPDVNESSRPNVLSQ